MPCPIPIRGNAHLTFTRKVPYLLLPDPYTEGVSTQKYSIVFGKGMAHTATSKLGASAPEVCFLSCKTMPRVQGSPRLVRLLVLGLLAFASYHPAKAATACIPFSDARNHIGATRCIAGKVLRVKQGNGGVHFFDFCEDYRV